MYVIYRVPSWSRQTDQRQADVTSSAPSAVILHVWPHHIFTTVYIDTYRHTWNERQQHRGLLLHLHLSPLLFLTHVGLTANLRWRRGVGEGGEKRGRNGSGGRGGEEVKKRHRKSNRTTYSRKKRKERKQKLSTTSS